MVRKAYFTGGSIRLSTMRHVNAKMGRGMGSVLLDGGLGGQSSYSSLDDYLSTTNKLTGPVIKGKGGAKGSLQSIMPRLEALSALKKGKKRLDSNIKFSI
jgi:hypothetical protein